MIRSIWVLHHCVATILCCDTQSSLVYTAQNFNGIGLKFVQIGYIKWFRLALTYLCLPKATSPKALEPRCCKERQIGSLALLPTMPLGHATKRARIRNDWACYRVLQCFLVVLSCAWATRLESTRATHSEISWIQWYIHFEPIEMSTIDNTLKAPRYDIIAQRLCHFR